MTELKATHIRTISVGLMLLYGISFATHLLVIELDLILCFLFFILFIGSVGAFFLKDWGRGLLVIGNIVLGVYILIPYIRNNEFALHISYIFMSIIILLFFNQMTIRNFFIPMKKGTWKSILVIDDDETLVRTVRPILISRGYSVLTANSGEAGLQVVKNQKPDMVILDVILPRMKGREVCRRIKEDKATAHIPVVFLTAKYSEDDIKAEMEAGALTHLTKPVSPNLLISTIESILKT